MPHYSGKSGSVAVGTDKTLITLISAATIRPKLNDILIGCVATPADAATLFSLMRFTAVGTEGSGFTPTQKDLADGASRADCGQGVFGGEPTYTAASNLLDISMNQRSTQRWVASPGGEFIAPKTANAGLGVRSLSSTVTTAHEVSIQWEE